MAKSKRRIAAGKARRARKAEWKSMTPEARLAYNEHRFKTAKSGYAKRRRERARGVPMSDRSKESPAWHHNAWAALRSGALIPAQGQGR